MNKSFQKSYLKIYFWRSISVISGFTSLLIVVPHLSNNSELYGIYTYCISFSLYLTYADIGFLGAGQKYAGEEFARGNRNEEINILGFTGAILLLLILPFSLAMIYFSFHPGILINVLSEEGQKIAGNIFLIIGLVSPFQVIIQRLVQSILIIRVKDYISLRIDIMFNILKILSVFFFFSKGRFMIVEYFLAVTMLNLFSSLFVLIVIYRTENYDFVRLLKSIRLSKKYFYMTKKLAFSSLTLTVGWLIYYELDLIAVGKLFGPHEVAIYAIGFTFLTFLRALWNIVFSPYAQRFNHFAGTEDLLSMKNMINKIIDYTLPLSVLTTLILLIGAKYIVLYWVGVEYIDAIIIMKLLISCTLFGFVTIPASYYFTAETKYKSIYLIAIISPIIFIFGVLIFKRDFGFEAIAISKLITMFVIFIISLIGLSGIISPLKIIIKWGVNLFFMSCLLIYLVPIILTSFFEHQEKDSTQLALLILVLIVNVGISYFIILITKKQQRTDVQIVFSKLRLSFKQ